VMMSGTAALSDSSLRHPGVITPTLPATTTRRSKRQPKTSNGWADGEF
jgi:hypothetical protein